MSRTFANEIVETSQTIGAGTYDLDGAKGSYRAFRQGYSDGDLPSYSVRNATNTKWEQNRGGALTVGTPDRLARNVVLSTNGNAPVAWTTGDLPLTVYVPRDADLDEGVVTGWLAAARPALLRDGARWWDTTAGVDVRWIETLIKGVSNIRTGFFDAVKALYFPDNRRSSAYLGAANNVFTADDCGRSFTFNTSDAQRTATLPLSSDAGDGYNLELKGLSVHNGVLLTPAAGDSIDGGVAGATRLIPGGVLFKIRWDAGVTQWITDYVKPAATMYSAKTISGLTYQNNATDATNDIDIATGGAMDTTGAIWMPLDVTLTKRLDAAWAVGGGNGGLDTGAIGNNDYYIWLIIRSDTGVVDILFSLSSTAPNMPDNYDFKRRIGWFKRVSSTIVPFRTWELSGGGLALRWITPTLDINAANALTTSRQLDAVKVPLNFETDAYITVSIVDASSTALVRVCSPAEANASISDTGAPLANINRNSGGTSAQTDLIIRTNSVGQIAARASIATVDQYAVQTNGFDWQRR